MPLASGMKRGGGYVITAGEETDTSEAGVGF